MFDFNCRSSQRSRRRLVHIPLHFESLERREVLSGVATAAEIEPAIIQISQPQLIVSEKEALSTIEVRRSGNLSAEVSVQFATSDIGATAASDYVSSSGTLSFAAGEERQTIRIPILADQAREANEGLRVTLSNATGGAELGDVATTVLTIADDDGTQNERFVSQFYRDLLGREAEPEGLEYYVRLLELQQASRTEIALMFQQSDEYRARLIEDLYQQYLRRPSDAPGRAAHSALLANGGSIDELRATFLDSGEYYQTRAANSDDEFVRAIFDDTMGYLPNDAEQALCLELLQSGAPRKLLPTALLVSETADRALTAAWYYRFLGRENDAAGLAFHSHALQSGVPEQFVVAGLVASDEYFERFADIG